jgi:hypothetical protein
MTPNSSVRYIDGAGRLTADGLRLFRNMAQRIDAAETGLAAAESKLAAIAAVANPAGGATIDAEARAAINAIIAGAT